jgi:hypothetical protein
MIERRPPRLRARIFGNLFAYVVLWPVVRVLELFGAWPRLMSRAMARMSEQFEGFDASEHDVLVCSYFKTGTNWTMQIAAQIAFRGHGDFAHIHDVVPWLELPDHIGYTVSMKDDAPRQLAPTGLRVIKTHLPMRKLGYSPRGKYIWVVRDPKDVFVSSYHFTRSTVLGPLMPSVRRWLALYLSGEPFVGSWAEHAAGGWAHRDRPNVLFLTFEDMKRDLHGTVARIAALMEVELTPEELESVVRQSTYEHMKSIGHKFDTVGLSPPWAAPKGAMVRRGQSGSANELLTAEDQQRIDAHWRAELQRLGSDFPYDSLYGAPRPL